MGGNSLGDLFMTKMGLGSCNRRWRSSSSSVWMVLVILAAFRISDTLGKVHIKELQVPQSVQNGTTEPIILDCDYTYDDEDKNGLVVKWFFNKGQSPVYQWIKDHQPTALGVLRDRLDLKYKSSDDKWEKYRGIRILQPTTDLTGEWACRVSSFMSEATAASRMVVYASQKEMGIHQVSRPTVDSINISCWANGVYPEPKLTLTYNQKKLEDVMHESSWNDGAYDVRVSAIVQDEDLELPALFDCELKIPDTSYIHHEKLLYGGPPQMIQQEELANETSTASGPLLSNVSRTSLIAWFNIILLIAVNMKVFGLS